MRKLLIFTALLASLTLYSCSEDIADDGTIDSSGFVDSSVVYLSSFSASKIPDYDDWVINDTEADTDDFEGLSAAINALAESGREITLSFPQIDSIPSFAIFGVEEIDYYNFNSEVVVGVSAAKAVAIGDHAFALCLNLSSLDFPEVDSISDNAFVYGSSITSVTSTQFPKLTTLGGAFSLCSGITEVDLPSVTFLGNKAFGSCTSLTDVSLDAVTLVGEWAFNSCTALETIDLPAAEVVGYGAFNACSALTAAYLPETVTLAKWAFYFCTALDTVELPKATTIGDQAFYSCSALASLSLPEVAYVGYGAFYSCSALSSISLPVATEVGYESFRSCESLTSIELPALTILNSGMFYDSAALSSISLPAVTIINTNAFYNCSSLTALEVATDTDVILGTVVNTAFTSVDTSAIALTIGSANSESVDGSTLNIGGVKSEFASISVI